LVDFRSWLISQGRLYYEQALKTPERAADDAIPREEAECEEFAYAADYAYERAMAAEMPAVPGSLPTPAKPAGEPWKEEALVGLYPQLYARFRWV
jgi:hypothetical protein